MVYSVLRRDNFERDVEVIGELRCLYTLHINNHPLFINIYDYDILYYIPNVKYFLIIIIQVENMKMAKETETEKERMKER